MKTKNRLAAIAMLLMLFVIVMPAMVENASASNGLGGIWHFEEGTGTVAYDSSGNGNHGTVYGGAIWIDGKIGKALEFDGINDYVNVPDSNSLDITGKITLEAWIYPYTVTTMQVIVQKYNYSGPPYNGAYYLEVGGYGYNNKVLFGLSHNGYNFYYILSNTNIAANTWTHVAATSNGTHMIIYINGIKDKVATYSPGVIYASAAPLRIGCFLPELGVSRFFDGVIDEVRVSSGTIWTVDDDRVQCPNADFTSIQAAVNIASPDDTIIVHDGTYNENLVVNKALTIKAASKPIIDGGAAGDCISVSVNNVFISGFEIRNGYNGISGQTSGSTFSNNIIHDNLNIPGSAGVGILLWGDNDNNIVTGNEIYNNDRQGIFIGYGDDSKISTGNVIENDVIYDNGLYRYANGPDASAYGIQLWCADYNLIKNNEIYLHDDWFAYPEFDFAQGIYLCDANGNTVVGNYLHDNNYGVGLWHPARSIGNNYINYNNIAGNTGYGVCTFDGLPAVDGRFNWWGDASGPTHSSNTGGTGDSISDNVDYSPWLGATFATTPRTYHVNPTGTIQEAIDEASPDDTIIVHEGTYYENLIVPKSLTIQGVDKETVVLQAQPVGYGDKAIEILASDVTISGFTISGYAATETKPGSTYWGAYAYGSSSSRYSNIMVANCIFTFLSQSGIQLGYVDGSLIADNIFKRETRLVWYDPPGPTPGSYIEVTRGGAGPAL
jgi:parallel beta-helix repeat protein